MFFSFLSWSDLKRGALVMAAVLLLATVAAPVTASAADCTPQNFFGLEPWYKYLPHRKSAVTQKCEITSSSSPDGAASDLLGSKSYIILILLAIIDDLLRIAGVVAVAFVIIGGFRLITSQGDIEDAPGRPSAVTKAKHTIAYALAGLAIALLAVVIVSFIGNSIGASA